MTGLVLSVIATRNDLSINDAINLCDDLAIAQFAEEEFLRWKRRWIAAAEDERQGNLCVITNHSIPSHHSSVKDQIMYLKG